MKTLPKMASTDKFQSLIRTRLVHETSESNVMSEKLSKNQQSLKFVDKETLILLA